MKCGDTEWSVYPEAAEGSWPELFKPEDMQRTEEIKTTTPFVLIESPKARRHKYLTMS